MSLASREVDLIVLGSGAGGMTAALTAAIFGLDVALVEKTQLVGGTSARSAGSVWVPNSRHSAPGTDDPDKALLYLRCALGNRMREAMTHAYLDAGPAMIALLEDNSEVAFRPYAHHPDYLATLPGATLSGRVLEPVPFDAVVLGKNFSNLRPPLPEFTLFGGMMVDRTDIAHLLNASKSARSLLYAAGLVSRYGLHRVRFARGARLVMGNALVGRLYYSLLQRGVPVMTSTQAQPLIAQDGGVIGAKVTSPEGTFTLTSRRGIVLATGGISRNSALRAELMPSSLNAHTPVAEGATGDGARFAQRAGGHLGSEHASNSFWSPISLRKRRDGSIAAFPHLVLDRGKPGLIAVDPDGKRFVSESTNYHLFVEAMFGALKDRPGQSCCLICDDHFIAKYGLGMVRPRRLNLAGAIRDGYLTRADTIAGLAQALGMPADALERTIARHNSFVATGVDVDFGKGSDAYQRNLGDAAHKPNPCIGLLAKPPFYAVNVFPGDIGASVGLVTNEHAQVLRQDGSIVAGLYACGNDMDSIMAGIYPGPGITLGPAMAFGYIAARHAAGK
ncbi:MAG TPA: FAD-dependent oxidoreductase [Hyphomicrobiaceae bacterium]|nr:FAD-dependent oxidoreductase [Hyphomicrobiaceae bacterium]